MLQEIMDMVKLLDHQQQAGVDGGGERTDRRPSLEELLAYLHQANPAAANAAQAGGGDQRLRDPAVPNGLAANFEEIIAQHIAYNGTARQQAALQQQQAKRKQAKRATGGNTATAPAMTNQAVRNALKNLNYAVPDELVQEVFTDDERTVALFRSLGPVEGVSVEFHRLDEQAEGGGSGGKKATKKVSGGASSTKGVKGGGNAAPSAAPPAAEAPSGSGSARSATHTDFAAPVAVDLEVEEVELGDDVVVHEEDLQQINHMIQALEPLSQETLEELSSEWEVSFPNGGEHLLYRTNITERIRFLAATMVVGVADRFQVLQNNHTNSQDAERERMMLVNNLVLSLWHGINVLTENVRKNFAVIFGLESDSTAHDVCVAVAGLGIAAFFEPLPVPLIEKVCSELNLPALDPKTDPDLIHEALSHRICAHFYPVLGRLPDMNLRCTTQLTVHENGPGSYTCTIDNALLMDLIMRQVHTSNRFSCQKLKWRARVEVQDGQLSFSVLHHEPNNRPVNVTLVVRTSEKGKKKKPIAGDADGSALTSGGLYLEKKDVAAPGKPVGFRNVVPLEQVYSNVTTSPNGLRLYSRAEDRVIFQFSMEVSPYIDGQGAAEGKPTAAAAAAAVPIAAPAAKGKGSANSGASSGGNNASTVDASTAGQTIAELIEQEEREKREKQLAKAKQKNDKRTRQLEQTESQARDQILSHASTAHSQIMAECTKSHQKAAQKKKDRERKQELAKATPSAELQTQLSTLEQSVRAARAALSKLALEKSKEDKEIASLSQQLDARNEELARLQAQSEENEETLHQLHEEMEAAEERIEEKKKRMEAKKDRQARRKPSGNSASHSTVAFGQDEGIPAANTLSIKDFQSFWDISSSSVPSSGTCGVAPPLTAAGSGVVGGSSSSTAQSSVIAMGGGAGSSAPMMSHHQGSNPMTLGLDLGAFGQPQSSGPPMMHSLGGGMGGGQQMPGMHMGRHNIGFSLNGDAPPFYGSTYVESGNMQMKQHSAPAPLMSSGPQPRSPMPTFGSAGGGGPLPGGAPFAPPNGFSPYGGGAQMHLGRIPSPGPTGGGSTNSPMMGHGMPMHGNGGGPAPQPHHRGGGGPAPGHQYPQQQRNAYGSSNSRGGYGNTGYEGGSAGF